MRINKNTIDILLALDDEKLAYIVGTVLRQAGIDVSEFGISGNDISELSDEELAETERRINSGRRGGYGNG